MAVSILLRNLQILCKHLRRLVETGNVLLTLAWEARSIVPAYRPRREKRNVVGGIGGVTHPHGVLVMLLIVAVKASHIVEGDAVDTKQFDIILHLGLPLLTRVAASAGGKLQMQAGETRLAHFIPEVLHGLCRLLRAGETLFEDIRIEHRAHRTAIYLHIVREMEILRDDTVNDLLPVNHADARVEQQGICIRTPLVPVPVTVLHIVVGVHDVEIHLAVRWCPEEALVQGILQIGTAPAIRRIIPVPVVDEDVHPVAKRLLDLEFHHLLDI